MLNAQQTLRRVYTSCLPTCLHSGPHHFPPGAAGPGAAVRGGGGGGRVQQGDRRQVLEEDQRQDDQELPAVLPLAAAAEAVPEVPPGLRRALRPAELHRGAAGRAPRHGDHQAQDQRQHQAESQVD